MSASMANSATILLCLVGSVLVLAYLLLGLTRRYLLYLGLTFLAFAVSLRAPHLARMVLFALALVALIFAIHDAIREAKRRLISLREESRERETAFGEILKAQVKKEEAGKGEQEKGQDTKDNY